MAKLTLNDLSSLTNESAALSTLNNNNSAIETALENTLSRDGTSPNQMAAAFDMNSNRILNLPAPATSTEPLRLQELTAFVADNPGPTLEAVELETFGGAAGGADNVAAWAAALAYCAASGARVIQLRAGIYYFNSKPAVISRGITIRGLSKSASILVRNYTAGSATEGFIEFDGASGEFSGDLRDVSVYAATGTTSGAGIKLTGVSTASRASFNSFHNLNISGIGTGTWAYPIYCNGSAITTAGSQGLRDLSFMNVTAFNATTAAVYLNNCVNVGWIGGGIFQGAGTTSKFHITGAASGATAQSQGIVIHTNLVGSLETTYCSKVKFVGEVDTYIRDATASDVMVVGSIGGQSGSAGVRELLIDTVTGIDTVGVMTGRGGFLAPTTTNVPAYKSQIGTFGGTVNGDAYLGANIYYNPVDFTWRTINTYGGGVVGYTLLQAGILGTLKVAGSTAATTAGAAVTPTFVDVVKQGDIINLPAGSVSVPAINFGGDVDTGIYSPSAGNVVIATNGFASAQFSATQFVQSRDGAAPNLTAQRADTTHGSGQNVGTFVFRGYDNAGTPNSTIYAQLVGNCVSNTDTAEEGKLDFQVVTAGSVASIFTVVGASATSSKALFSSNATSGLGYTTGAGGSVTQATSRTTGVTLNKVCGAITLFNAAPAVGTWVSFTVTNSAVAATDTVVVSVKSGTNTYIAHVTAVAAGSFQISITSIVGTASDSPVINFAVLKAVTS